MAESKYYGIYQGIVTQIEDPEKRGRIKCKIPDCLAGDVESAWCDPLSIVAYDTGGDFCLPQVKEAVWILFIAGDVNRPVWCGGWWQKNKTPLGETYTRLDDTRIMKYQDWTIVIHKKEMTITNESENMIKMDSDGILLKDKFGNTIKMGAGGIIETAAVGVHHSKGPQVHHN